MIRPAFKSADSIALRAQTAQFCALCTQNPPPGKFFPPTLNGIQIKSKFRIQIKSHLLRWSHPWFFPPRRRPLHLLNLPLTLNLLQAVSLSDLAPSLLVLKAPLHKAVSVPLWLLFNPYPGPGTQWSSARHLLRHTGDTPNSSSSFSIISPIPLFSSLTLLDQMDSHSLWPSTYDNLLNFISHLMPHVLVICLWHDKLLHNSTA